MSKKRDNILLLPTYLAMIKGSVGSKICQRLFIVQQGKVKDILYRGKLSCAFFVSLILKFFDLIKSAHATVAGLEEDLLKSGWYKINKPKVGSVLVWQKNSTGHRHIGFYIGGGWAVSNSTSKRVPRRHHFTFGREGKRPKRAIEAIYWHDKLKGNL